MYYFAGLCRQFSARKNLQAVAVKGQAYMLILTSSVQRSKGKGYRSCNFTESGEWPFVS